MEPIDRERAKIYQEWILLDEREKNNPNWCLSKEWIKKIYLDPFGDYAEPLKHFDIIEIASDQYSEIKEKCEKGDLKQALHNLVVVNLIKKEKRGGDSQKKFFVTMKLRRFGHLLENEKLYKKSYKKVKRRDFWLWVFTVVAMVISFSSFISSLYFSLQSQQKQEPQTEEQPIDEPKQETQIAPQ